MPYRSWRQVRYSDNEAEFFASETGQALAGSRATLVDRLGEAAACDLFDVAVDIAGEGLVEITVSVAGAGVGEKGVTDAGGIDDSPDGEVTGVDEGIVTDAG